MGGFITLLNTAIL